MKSIRLVTAFSIISIFSIWGCKKETNTVTTSNLPVANYTYTKGANDSIFFKDQSTGIPNSWLWIFGDGSTSSIQNPVYHYSSLGTYPVTLQVTNSAGSNQKIQNIVVSTIAPVANFSYTDDMSLNVTFYDQSTNTPTTWLWNFGDGNTSTLQNPTHTYAHDSSYNITLQVTNSAGFSQQSQIIQVTNLAFFTGAYAIVDVSNGFTYNYMDNLVIGQTHDKIYCQKFAYYINALIYFTVSGNNINIPSQTVTCGAPPNDVPHTFQGSGNYTHNGANVTINMTYSDNSVFGNFTNCTATYTRQSEKLKNNNSKDKSWYLMQASKK